MESQFVCEVAVAGAPSLEVLLGIVLAILALALGLAVSIYIHNAYLARFPSGSGCSSCRKFQAEKEELAQQLRCKLSEISGQDSAQAMQAGARDQGALPPEAGKGCMCKCAQLLQLLSTKNLFFTQHGEVWHFSKQCASSRARAPLQERRPCAFCVPKVPRGAESFP